MTVQEKEDTAYRQVHMSQTSYRNENKGRYGGLAENTASSIRIMKNIATADMMVSILSAIMAVIVAVL